jgi:hypothetical protein
MGAGVTRQIVAMANLCRPDLGARRHGAASVTLPEGRMGNIDAVMRIAWSH